MDIVNDIAPLRTIIANWQARGERIAFVPTMGNLHAGHYALVEQARAITDRVVVSIFVNPTQFGPNEDFSRYPRTPQEDADGLRAYGCDLLFLPAVDAIYPLGIDRAYRVCVPALADVLCGAHRPGHFDGVATVVSRLFTLVQPDAAVFGEKDFQQLRIIERMTLDLGYAIAIERGRTVREADGLAMSSRNRFLDERQRAQASGIRTTLLTVAERWLAGEGAEELARMARRDLESRGFEVDYAEIRREEDLGVPDDGQRDGVRAFVAIRTGSTRLIDNISLGRSNSSD